MTKLKQIVIESGEYVLKTTIRMPSNDIFIVGKQGAVIVPIVNVLPIQGVGDDDISCLKCDYLLASKVSRNQILVPIKCPSCGTIIYL